LSSMTTVRSAIRALSPLLYGRSCVAVFVVTVLIALSPAVVRYLDALPGGSHLVENPALALVLLLLICTLLFAVLDQVLYGLERLQRPGLIDHARHCALLYEEIVFVFVVLLTIPDLQAGMLQYDLGFALCAVGAYGIVVDGAVVLLKRRLARAQPGGAV
jgi:hypothetical protein